MRLQNPKVKVSALGEERREEGVRPGLLVTGDM